MKIVSKFKDYYDHVAYAYGIDDHVTYDRSHLTEETNDYGYFTSHDYGYFTSHVKCRPDLLIEVDNGYDHNPFSDASIRRREGNYRGSTIYPSRLIVAGRVFPVFPFDGPHLEVFNPKKHTEYVGELVSPTRGLFDRKKIPFEYDLKPDSGAVKLSRLVKHPVFILHNHEQKYGKFKFYISGYLPILKDLGLASVYPAQQLYQDLDYFLTNTMYDSPDVQPQGKPPQTDKEKISAHGFDLKKSFRHRVER